MKTVSTVVRGAFNANSLVLKLISESQWFEFEPLPEDLFKITVKVESSHLLAAPGALEVMVQVPTYLGDQEGAPAESGDLTLDMRVQIAEQLIIDLAKPGVRWQDGPRIYLERRLDQWRAYIHLDNGDTRALVYLNDDATVGLEEF